MYYSRSMSTRQPERNRRNFSRAMRRDGYLCRYCGDPADSVDHIVPVCYRSDNRLANLAAACMSCNLTASGFVFSSFEAKRAYIRTVRGLPAPPPAVAQGLVAEPPRAPLVTVVDAIWGDPEDEGWPLPEDPPEILCAGTTRRGRRCRLLAAECVFHDNSPPSIAGL
jgi:hypothetical protein